MGRAALGGLKATKGKRRAKNSRANDRGEEAAMSKTRTFGFLVVLAAVPASVSAAVATTSYSAGEEGPHPKALRIAAVDGGHLISVGLAGLPKGTRVYRSRLRAWRGKVKDAKVLLEDVAVFAGDRAAGRPLELLGPWYDAFDATAAVTAAVGAGQELKLFVRSFPAWQKERTRLEVAYEGAPGAAPPPVSGLRVLHRSGQTFITWKEVGPLIRGEKATWGEIRTKLAAAKDACTYRIYASKTRIAATNLLDARLVAEVGPLSCWNVNGRNMEYLIGQAMIESDEIGELARDYGGHMYTWGPDSPRMDRYPVDRFVIDAKAGPLPPGTGLYVHHPAEAGRRYYAVVSCRGGVENTRELSAANSLEEPVEESVGIGEPVRQGKGLWGPFFDYPGTRWVYVQWCAPPLCPLPSMYFNWTLLLPPGLGDGAKVPGELYLHRGGNWSHAKPRKKLIRASIQIAPHDFPASGWYGYNSSFGTLRSYKAGAVSNHTHRRIFAFLEWAARAFPLDRERIVLPGADQAVVLAMNYPEAFAYVLVMRFGGKGKIAGEVLAPDAEQHYGLAWGPKSPAVRDDKGRAEWGWAMLDRLALASESKHLPLMCCGGRSWGRVYQYGKGFGPFYDAMQKARQPLIGGFGWDTKIIFPDKHTGQWRGLDLTRATPVLAFRNSSASAEKLQQGNVNWYHRWKDLVDEPERFAATIWSSYRDCTFDVTPRRLRNFRPPPGQKLAWEARNAPSRRVREPWRAAGAVAVDDLGLFTIRGIKNNGSTTVTVSVTRAE